MTEDLRAFLQEGRDKTAEIVADLSDKLSETATGKKLAKAQAQLAFWDAQLAKLPAVKAAPVEPAVEEDEFSDEAMEAAAARADGAPTPRLADRDDPGPMPGFLDRSKKQAAE